MEDDADWDVSIKTQLQNFAIALRQLQGNTELISTSPFGDGWDILWLGHCGLQCKPMLPAYLTPNDPTVPPSHHFLPYLREQPPFERPENGRLTCAAHDIACGSFYAVSYRGAQKILAALSVIPLGLAEEIDIGDQVDTSLGRLCGHGYLKCFATYPALTGKFRAAGANGKVSDVHNRTGIAKGFASWGVMYSTMLNIQQVMKGEVTALATWDDVNVPETKNLRMDSVPRSYMRIEEEILLQEGTILQEVMYNSGVPKREDI
ncbi:CAZyme family GT25 [Penicillium malachiteum]|nr:CAZyme family GT25 [Penicillium malachiteum]